MMQNLDVFDTESFFLLNTLLRVTKQGISISVCFALAVIDPEVVTRKFLSLANLFGTQTLGFHELSKVVIVGKHKDFILKAL